MFIYVVREGDSLFSIATKYQVNMDSIRIYNGLRTDTLVPGQDLIIPSNVYIVQPGDSLYSISQMSSIPIQTLRIINGLSSNMLMIGMNLYLPPRNKYKTIRLSYIVPSTPEENKALVLTFAPISTFFGIFDYYISEDGNLSTLDDQQLINLARENSVAPLAVITNLTPTGFSSQLVKTVLNSREISDNLINNIFNLLESKNYAGVNIDFELVSEDERDLYSDFLRRLKEKLKPNGYYTTAAVPAKTNDIVPWLKGYDYGGIGAAVDFVFIMAYDWHELSTPPGPVAPINEVRNTIEYALHYMERNKILLGLPRYGYDWTMSNGTVISANAISSDDALETATRYQVPIRYSSEYQEPFFYYVDEAVNRHEVWFEDARSLTAKLQLAPFYGLGGGGAWQLGLPFTKAYILITEYFTIEKIL